MSKIKSVISLSIGEVLFTLANDVQAIWDGENVGFNADYDEVAEAAVMSGRADLLPLLTHRRMVPVNDEESVLKEVVYNPLAKPIFRDIKEEDLPVVPVEPVAEKTETPDGIEAADAVDLAEKTGVFAHSVGLDGELVPNDSKEDHNSVIDS